MSAAAASQKTTPSATSRLWSLLCFAALGSVYPAAGADGLEIAVSALAGLLSGWLFLLVWGWMLALFFRSIGRKRVKTAVSRGFLLLIPFTILALAAEWGLSWPAAGAFAAAGIMTSSTAVGAELAQAGGGKRRSSLLPVLGGAAITTGWMVTAQLVTSLLAAR